MLPVSRRCSRLAAKCLRPAGIPVLLGGAGAYTATPGKSYVTRNMERVVEKNTKDCKVRRRMPESQQNEEKRNEKEKCGW